MRNKLKGMKSSKYIGTVLLVLPIFLMLDASLAFVLGERYKYWGLEYTPAWYSSFILKLYISPRPFLWLSMLAEFMVGFAIFFLVLKSITKHDQ